MPKPSKLSMLARLEAIEAKLKPDVLEIINPRSFNEPSDPLQQAALIKAKLAYARRSGFEVITITNPRSFD